MKDNSLDFDENEENGFDDNYLDDHYIGGLAFNNFYYTINSKAKELENEINDIIRNYEYEHENNYNEDELRKLLNDFFENNKKIKVENVDLYIDDIDINFDTDSFIFRLTNSNSISISLNCDAYVQQYLDFKINNFEKIIEERFKKQTQQEDDSHSILLNCDRYFQQYLDFEINNYEKIMEERFSQENTQTDDFEL